MAQARSTEPNQFKLPAHVQVYRQLRDMLLCGDLAPGQAVTIQGLIDTLGAGMTPVREAIRRLTSEGALEFSGNRRIRVPILTEAQLDEIAIARLAIEPQLVEWGARKATLTDIQTLDGIDQSLNMSIRRGDVKSYQYHNYQFHMHLYRLSEAEILMGLTHALWLRIAPSLRVVCGRFGTANLPDMHAIALQHLRDGNFDAVVEDIRQDILQGMGQIRETICTK